jgi:hypothetical protein
VIILFCWEASAAETNAAAPGLMYSLIFSIMRSLRM